MAGGRQLSNGPVYTANKKIVHFFYERCHFLATQDDTRALVSEQAFTSGGGGVNQILNPWASSCLQRHIHQAH